MHSECVPFSKIPHTTPLFLDYLHDFSRANPFFVRPPLQTEWFAGEARSIVFPPERRARVAAVLERQNRVFGASAKTLANIERLRAGASAGVTGQQVGLFGGPLFSLLKALTAIRIAEESSRAGAECVPIFWLATEDHDLAEVNQLVVRGDDGVLHALRASVFAAEDTPVGEIRFGQEIEPLTAQLAEWLGSAEVVQRVSESYRPGVSFGEAFGRLFARTFRDFGVILLDANDPELHRLAAPIYADAVRGAAELDAELLQRGEALQKLGYHEQVKVTPSSSLLFALRDGARTVVHRSNGRFSIAEEHLQPAELLDRIAAAPEYFSANVLLRPVVQDFLLPTLTYVGGPAEVAYFAQAAVVYRKLLGRITPVWPRVSVTLVEPHIRRLLERYGLNVSLDVFQGPEHLREVLAASVLPPELQQNFDRAASGLEASLRELTESLGRLDHTLVDAAHHAGAKMRYQLDQLRKRAAQAEIRRSEILNRHAEQLISSLFPERNLQERVLGGICFLARDPDLLGKLYESASLTCSDHQLVYL